MIRTSAGAMAGLAVGIRASAEVAARPPAATHPNILFLMVDEMRWDCLGCAGHPVVKTPNLDRLAQQGLRFANSYSVAPVCCPARRSLFTGRYAHVHGVTQNGLPANDGEILITSILKHYDYTTAISGKLHFHPEGPDYDFDQFWSYANEGPRKLENYREFLFKKHGAKTPFPQKPGTCPWPEDPLGVDVGQFAYPKEDFMSYWIADRAVDFLRSRQGAEKPWFLFTSFLIPHSPYTAPEPYYSMYDPKSFAVPPIPPENVAARARLKGMEQRHMIADEDLLRAVSAQYFGHCTNVDDNVGRILSELDSLGMADNTIVVFTADHGNMLGDRGRMFKGIMYEGSSHVPHLMRAPKNAAYAAKFNTGRVIDEGVESVDVMPTLLEMAGLPVPEQGVQGKSLLQLAQGLDNNWKNRCFASQKGAMLRTSDYKLIVDGDTRELYDMRNDPKELHDLAKDPSKAELVADYANRIEAWQQDRPAPVRIQGMSEPSYARVDEATRRRLREDIKRTGRRRAEWKPTE